MPCYEVNTYTLAFKAKNVELIIAVLKDMGLNPRANKDRTKIRTSIGTFDMVSGEVEVESYNRSKVNDFRQGYSKKVIDLAAKKFKWNIKGGKRVGKKQTFILKKW